MSEVRAELPTYERISFPASAIELCVAQLRYPRVPRFLDEKFVEPITEALASDYPLFGKQKSIMQVTVTANGVNQTLGTVYRFTSIDRTWAVMLADEFVGLETYNFNSIDELSERFMAIIGHVETHFKPRFHIRFGLRFVNEFRLADGGSYATWRRALNPELLGIGAKNVIGGVVEQTIGEMRTRREDGVLLLRHGFLEGTTVQPIEGRPPKSGPFYLLDLDYYDESAGPFGQDIDRRIAAYNEVMYRIFRWSIGDGELYEQLRGTA